jgi:Protein of unknown function, DUF547
MRFSVVLSVLCGVLLSAQSLKGFDAILDTYVRDGEVYYRALKLDRSRLDAFVNQLAGASTDAMPRAEQIAFWINAYNALVLRTVVDHYPIQGRAAAYPQKSIRQIPGAFEKVAHRVAGRTLTLDQIEQTVLAEFHDPRIYFALGRGAEGGGRLRSEAYAAASLDRQLAEAAAECVGRQSCIHVDLETNKATASPIFSWREKEWIAAYADRAPEPFASRSPIERAVLAFVWPNLVPAEKALLEKNSFQLSFGTFDWRLNDLTGRGGR